MLGPWQVRVVDVLLAAVYLVEVILLTGRSPAAGLWLLVLGPGLLLVATTRRDPVAVLSLFVALLFVLPARLVVGPLGAAGTPATIIGVAAAWWWALGRLVDDRHLDTGFQPVRLAVFVFVWFMVLGYAAGFLRALVPAEISAADRAVISLAGLAGVALLAADGIVDRIGLDRLLRRLVLAAGFLAAIGIVQFSFGVDLASYIRLPGLRYNVDLATIAERSSFRRVSGTATHAIEFGVVLAALLPLALHYATAGAGSSPRWRRWVVPGLIAVAIPMSVSRSSVVGLVAGLLTMGAVWSWRRRLDALVVGVFFLAGVRAAIPGLLGTLKSLFLYTDVDPSITGRTDDFAIVRQLSSDAPVIGRGFGTLIPEKYFFLDNQYLGTLVETGVLGLAALILLLVVGASVARGARHRGRDGETRSLGQALAAGIVVVAVSLATFDGLSFRTNAGVLFLLLGCAGALWRLEVRTGSQPGGGRPAPTGARAGGGA